MHDLRWCGGAVKVGVRRIDQYLRGSKSPMVRIGEDGSKKGQETFAVPKGQVRCYLWRVGRK